MISELIEKLRATGTLAKWVIAGSCLMVILVIAIALRTQTKFSQYRLHETPLVTGNFGHLNGSELHAYNGLAFYKINFAANNEVAVLHSGHKLPVPESLHWADSNGALLTFKESFSYSLVEQALAAGGQSIDRDTELYTWYLDFASGALKQISQHPVKAGSAVFSSEKMGFYYIPDYSLLSHVEHEEIDPNVKPLYFYNIRTGQNEAVSNDLGVTDISHLGRCSATIQAICVIARDSTNPGQQRLYEINSPGGKKQLLEAQRLFPTNMPDQFLSVEGTNIDDSDREVVDYTEGPVRLHNIRTGTTSNLGFKTAAPDLIMHFANPNEFYIFDSTLSKSSSDGDGEYSFITGSTTNKGKATIKKLPLLYSDGAPLTKRFISTVNHGSGEMALLTSAEGRTLLMAPKDTAKNLDVIEQPKAQSAIDQCVRSSAKTSQYFSEEQLFKVFFMDDAGLAGNIKSFSSCLQTSNKAVFKGYNFYLGTIDPVNGRITSD